MILNSEWVNIISRRKSKDIWRKMKVNRNLWDTAKAVLRGKFIETQVYQETRKISHKQSNYTPKGNRKRINEAQSEVHNDQFLSDTPAKKRKYIGIYAFRITKTIMRVSNDEK